MRPHCSPLCVVGCALCAVRCVLYALWCAEEQVHVITEELTIESVDAALAHGPYGRCVYHCDNDVVDNQVVTFQFSDGSTGTFSMIGFTKEVCQRKTRIFGTRGVIEGDSEHIKVFDFLTRREQHETPSYRGPASRLSGHGYADLHLMSAFVDAVRSGDATKILSDPRETLASHVLVFLAEQARLERRIVTIE